MQRPLFLLLALTAMLLGSFNTQADDKINVAILTGQNNHGWMMDTPVLKNILDDAKRFDTTILQTPDRAAKNKAEQWQALHGWQFAPVRRPPAERGIRLGGDELIRWRRR